MADDLLLRARALINASNAISNVEVLPSIHKNVNINSTLASPEPVRKREANIPLNPNITTEFKCAAFTGSSLITTFKDIRKFAPRGGFIIIDGNRCKVSSTGDYTANRIELVEDYPGETNMEAVVQSASMKNKGKKKDIKERNNAVPIPKEAFSGALAGLSDVNDYVNNLQNKGAKKVPLQKPLKMKKIPASMQPGYQPYQTPKMEYDIKSEPPDVPPMDSPDRQSRVPVQQAPVKQEYQGSFIGGSPSNVAHHSPGRGNRSSSSDLLDKSPDPAQNPLWLELQNPDVFGPDAIEKRKDEHNQRLVEKGHAMAVERVDEYYKKAAINKDQEAGLEGYTTYDNKPSAHEEFGNIPSYVEQQRQVALSRVKLQRQREDAEVLRKLEEELEKKKQFKIRMETRAAELQKKTEERVAEAKRLKRQKELQERQRKAEEQQDREQRAIDAATNEERLAKIEQFKNETEQRMLKLSQRKEQKSRIEEQQYQQKLKQVQSKKLREVPTGEYIASRADGNATKDPDGLGEPLDDHYLPFKPNPDALPPINNLRSRSEQMSRTPKKLLMNKPKSEKKFAVATPQTQAQVNAQATPSEDRVVVEAFASNGVTMQKKTQDQRQQQQQLQQQQQQQQIVRQSKKDVIQPESKLSYEEQQELYFGRKPGVPVPPPEERVGYANPRQSRGRAIYVADDDDDDDDFLDDDSLGGVSSSPRSRKVDRNNNGNGKPSAKPVYMDEPIRMGYDEDDEPSAAQKSRAMSKKIAASGTAGAGTSTGAGGGSHRSRIPKRVVNKQELPASTEAASIALRSVVSMSKNDMDDMMDDLMSDVSSQEGHSRARSRELMQKPPKKNHGLNPLEIFFDKKPKPAPDPNESVAETPSSPRSHEKRKKKKQVWKMAPIPVKPYIAVAAPVDKW